MVGCLVVVWLEVWEMAEPLRRLPGLLSRRSPDNLLIITEYIAVLHAVWFLLMTVIVLWVPLVSHGKTPHNVRLLHSYAMLHNRWPPKVLILTFFPYMIVGQKQIISLPGLIKLSNIHDTRTGTPSIKGSSKYFTIPKSRLSDQTPGLQLFPKVCPPFRYQQPICSTKSSRTIIFC